MCPWLKVLTDYSTFRVTLAYFEVFADSFTDGIPDQNDEEQPRDTATWLHKILPQPETQRDTHITREKSGIGYGQLVLPRNINAELESRETTHTVQVWWSRNIPRRV